MVVQATVQQAKRIRPADHKSVRMMDVGTGTSPLLFTLVEREKFSAVQGVDWSHRAVEYMNRQASQRGVAEQLQYKQADGRYMVGEGLPYEPGSFDIVIDKGCLDCFVSGRGHNDVAAYLAQLALLLNSDEGTLILLPVNAAHIPTLLHTGAIVRETHMRRERHLSQSGTSQQDAKTSGGEKGAHKELPNRRDKRLDAGRSLTPLVAYARMASDAAWEHHIQVDGREQQQSTGLQPGAQRDWPGPGQGSVFESADARQARQARQKKLESVTGLVEAAATQNNGEAERRGDEKARTRQYAQQREQWTQRLFIQRVIACEDKHMFVCGLQPVDREEAGATAACGVGVLECGCCGRAYSSVDYPDVCAKCRTSLVRFALS